MTSPPAPATILSIQSHVVYGHAGNAAATFPMQRLGAEVWPLHTVQFSNHTAYGAWRGSVFPPEHLRDLVQGLAERELLRRCDAVISGFLGSAALGEAILDAVAQIRQANPNALYLCDPVMGNPVNGCTVASAIPSFLKARALPAADILTPSFYELEWLTDHPLHTLPEVVQAIRHLQRLGPKVVLAKGIKVAESQEEQELMLVADGAALWQVAIPHFAFPRPLVGTGDLIAGVFLVHYLRHRRADTALEGAAAAIYAVVEATHRRGAWELELIAAQDEFVTPTRRFTAQRLTG